MGAEGKAVFLLAYNYIKDHNENQAEKEALKCYMSWGKSLEYIAETKQKTWLTHT
jgi:hypothetical protein